MNKKIIILLCFLLAMVWTAGCACMKKQPEPVAAPPPPVEAPAPRVEAPPPPPPQPRVEQPAPSKKMKERVIKEQPSD